MTGYKVPKSLIDKLKTKFWIASRVDRIYSEGMDEVLKAIESLGEEELDGWQTGVPTEEGDYLVAVKYENLIDVEYQINRYILEPYNDFIYQIEGEGKIVVWQKINPYEGKINDRKEI